MLTQEDDVEIHALAARGWTKAAIAQAYRPGSQDRREVPRPPEGRAAGAGSELS